MQENYNLESDSDEEEDEEIDLNAPANKNMTWQLSDIEKLKEQTTELLDSKWKETRNMHLLRKMLELEQPSITLKMVDFLVQQGVCESLLGFITLNGPDRTRPLPSDSNSDDLKFSYRAVILLSPEVPSDALNAFLSKKGITITRKLFDMFRGDSGGSFYHAYRLMECLLRCHPADVFEGICGDGFMKERMMSMLKYIGYPPVCELIVMLVALTTVPRMSSIYSLCSKGRLKFFQQLQEWNFMLKIVEVVVKADEICDCSGYIKAEQHSGAASQLLLDLIDKLCVEENSEILLEPIGQSTALLDLLIDTVTGGIEAKSTLPNITENLQITCTRLLCFLLRRAAETEIVCYVTHPNGAPPTPTLVPNRLNPMRQGLVTYLTSRISAIVNYLLQFETMSPSCVNAEPMKYSSYTIPKPFTCLRNLIIDLMTLIVESDESAAAFIPQELWKLLISWVLKYHHNNIYHATFYRLIFAVLRQGQEAPQRVLFQKTKFGSFLIEQFLPYPTSALLASSGVTAENTGNSEIEENADTTIASGADPTYARRNSLRGLIMNCANAIRLQVGCQNSGTFLVQFFNSSQKWNDFLAQLKVATDIQMRFGMGIKMVAENTNASVNPNNEALSMFINEAKPTGEEVLNQTSRFARSLGFFDEAAWTEKQADPAAPAVMPTTIEGRTLSLEDIDARFSDLSEFTVDDLVMEKEDISEGQSENVSLAPTEDNEEVVTQGLESLKLDDESHGNK